MSVKQLSVFAENRNGSIYEITKILSDNEVDLRAFSVAETASFGVLRLIVDDPRKAALALSKEDKIVNVTEVVGAAIPDERGGLAYLLGVLTEAGVSVEYLYAFVAKTSGSAFVVLRVENNEATEKLLTDAGIRILTDSELIAK